MNVSVAFALAAWVPANANAGVRISEFTYDVPGSDARNEWIEIFNDGPLPVDLSKWKVLDSARHVLNAPPKNGSTGTTTLQAGSYAILAADAKTFVSMHPGVAVSILDTSLSLPNAGGGISLIDSKGTPVDTIAYSAALGAAGNGNSLQRNSSGKWIEAKPTAGAANAQIAQPTPLKTIATSATKSVAKKRPKPVDEPKRDEEGEVVEAPQPDIRAERGGKVRMPESQVAAAYSGLAWSPTSPWFLGVLGIVGIAAVVSIAVTRTRKEEWEIIEETD